MDSLQNAPGFIGPLLAAIVAGGLIGFEREWRGRAAGFRTHILVCLGSALLMEAAAVQGLWRFLPQPSTDIVADPTRMAHGVLTGIGFLCAGVIFRSGFSIHGLTTAASLWMTAAIGLVFGAGLYGLGAAATILSVAILIVLRLVSARLPDRTVIDARIVWARDAAGAEAAVLEAVSTYRRRRGADHHALVDGGRGVALSLRLSDMTPDDASCLGRRLRDIPGVTGYDLDPRDD